MKELQLKNIKLIIWDMDNTFWRGIISEGQIEPVLENINFVKKLTDAGIMNSICSKNNFDDCENKLKELGVWDLFIFPSINWEPKGGRVKQIIEEVQLREENILFIDDDVLNIKEVLFYNPNLLTCAPEDILGLIEQLDDMDVKVSNRKRLQQYKTLEKKTEDRKSYGDNRAFLHDSDIKVVIKYDCEQQLSRIFELVQRTNQLNFTKVRASEEELRALFKSGDQCGYVEASDKYGDYGIVGFFAVKGGKLLHFLFSCRTIGQGVEQFVYAKLGWPRISIVPEVVSELVEGEMPDWINKTETHKNNENDNVILSTNQSVLLKGPCDLESMINYVQNSDVIALETTYVGTRGNLIEHQNHSYEIFNALTRSDKEKLDIINECVFSDAKMYDTQIKNKNIKLIVLSSLIECNLGVYQRKGSDIKIAFGEYTFPLTDKKFHNAYISGEIYTAQNNFSKEFLEHFSKNYEFCGRISVDQYIDNLLRISKELHDSHICVVLGSEIEYVKNSQAAYNGRHEEHRKMNERIRKLAAENSRFHVLDVNNYIKAQTDFTNNINHFNRRIYFELAQDFTRLANEILKTNTKMKSKFAVFVQRIKFSVKKALSKSRIISAIRKKNKN